MQSRRLFVLILLVTFFIARSSIVTCSPQSSNQADSYIAQLNTKIDILASQVAQQGKLVDLFAKMLDTANFTIQRKRQIVEPHSAENILT